MAGLVGAYALDLPSVTCSKNCILNDNNHVTAHHLERFL